MTTSKKIYLDGKYVGDVNLPIDADEDTEIQLARALLKEKGLHQEITPEQAIFRQARAFATTASYLYNRDLLIMPRNGLSIAPFVVNAAFAIELYIKTVAVLNGQLLKGHDLLKLFDALNTETKNQVATHFAKCQHQCGIENIEQYRTALEELRLAFVDWRYLHEDSDRRRSVTFAPMIFVMEALHETCRTHISPT